MLSTKLCFLSVTFQRKVQRIGLKPKTSTNECDEV